MEGDALYRELQQALDHMPVPFPSTESGVELRILKHLFTPEEAKAALCLSAIPEPLKAIHRRVGHGLTPEQLGEMLIRMAEKGSINKLPGKDGPTYCKAPLVLGMYEAQVDRLTPELERDVRAYLDEAFGRALHGLKTPQMLDLLEQADRQGLVLQPQNTLNPVFVCCCCGCCCGVLTTAKKLPKPASRFQTDFVARIDSDACQSCGECETRCQMDAVARTDGLPQVLEDNCIGCGLCVTTCPSGAMMLHRKDGRRPPPKDMRALYTTMLTDRYGKLGVTRAIAGHMLGRKF